ncbi:MAG TPA: hypothetical protein VM008_17385 [Phycisphaerae bacterium]|nr:hypothetical protein [Phycisphaerae bacterium]
MPETSTILSQEPFQPTGCTVCGEMHAVRRGRFALAVVEQLTIHCPAGHAYVPGRNPPSNLAQTVVELTAALADALAQLAVANQRVAELTPHAPPAKRELLRRARILAARAETRGRIAHPICPLCGAEKLSTDNLAKHLRRQHEDDLADMPASAFESGGQL